MSTDRRDQGVRDSVLASEASGARPDPPKPVTGIAALVQRVTALRPVRVFLHYSSDNGPLIASGMTYQALFALAAALWFAFSVFGFVLNGNDELQLQVFRAINRFLPNLIGYADPDGNGPQQGVDGAIQGSDLISPDGLTVSSIVSLVGVLFTAVGFLGTLRTAIRIMFALPAEQGNFAILKLKDLGYTVAFGALVLLTAAISVLSNTALDFVLNLLGLGDASALQTVAASLVAVVVLAGIQAVMLAAVFRILSGVSIPTRRLWVGALIGGVVLALLQTVGSQLLTFGTDNPAIKGFATLIGVLIFFNFVCQIILVSASWVAVGMADAGIDPRDLSPAQRAQERAREIEDARRLVAKANREVLQNRVREARGLRRWRLSRELQREVRAEAQRRDRVPTLSEFEDAQTGAVPLPDARQVHESGS